MSTAANPVEAPAAPDTTTNRQPTEYRNDSKPYDVLHRQFHRINSPWYDRAVDDANLGVPRKHPPLGHAQESGARTPADYAESGFAAKMLKKVLDRLKPLVIGAVALIPGVGPWIVLGYSIYTAISGQDPLDWAFKKLADWAGERLEGALFNRYMRAIPAWVPVGRVGYGPKFRYDEDEPARDTTKEEEREVEGELVASLQLWNDIPPTQWTRYDRWSFHVVPMRGYSYLIGKGNIESQGESFQMGRDNLQPFLQIYGQTDSGDDKLGALECLMDTGAISNPIGDGGTHGAMFEIGWPWWPMPGDHFWAAGRWAYDCMRPEGEGKEERFPTQLHPCKAFASARYEGHKFAENKGSVPAIKFMFLSTSEGGYINFRPVGLDVYDPKDKNKPPVHEVRQPPIALRDRDYEFIVDLPPHEEGKSPYPIGHTIEFWRNTLVLRPRLLMELRFAPFLVPNDGKVFTHGPEAEPRQIAKFHDTIVPKVELLRPEDPTKKPNQVKVTVPLTQLPKPNDQEMPEIYGFELTLGWQDPDGSAAEKIVRVRARLASVQFHGDSGQVRLKTCINGRWLCHALKASQVPFKEGEPRPYAQLQEMELFLPADARIAVTTHGVWRKDFGEYIEKNRLLARQLKFGSLIELHPAAQQRLDQLRHAVQQGNKLTHEEQEELKQLEELLETLDHLIGRRRKAEWLTDIDAKVADGKVESYRASAIARELWTKPSPIPIFSAHDQPMGWTEFLDSSTFPRDRNGALVKSQHIGWVVPDPGLCGTPAKLRTYMKQQNVKGVRVEMVADRATQVGSGNNLAHVTRPTYQIFGLLEKTDYSLDLYLEEITAPPPPPPPPPPPRPVPLIKEVVHPMPVSFYAQNTALLPDHIPIPLFGIFTTLYKGTDREEAIQALYRLLRQRQPDIVGLSENWVTDERARFAKELHDIYPFSREGPDRFGDFMASGVFLLSKFPIISSLTSIYRQTKGDDGLTAKGVLHARIAPPGAPCALDVFVTHTQSPFKSATDDLDPAREPALKAQLRHLGAFIAACRDPAQPAILMGDLNVVGNEAEIYGALMNSLGNPLDLWHAVGPGGPGLTNDLFRSFEADEVHTPKPLTDKQRYRAGFRLDYFLSWTGSLFRPSFGPMAVIPWEQRPNVDMSDHYGIIGGQTQVTEGIYDQTFPIKRVAVRMTKFKCLVVTGITAAGDEDVQFTLRCRAGTVDPAPVESQQFTGISNGAERVINSRSIELGDPGQAIEIIISGKKVGSSSNDLGTSKATVTKSELLAWLDRPVARAMPPLLGDKGEYVVEVEIVTS